MNGAWLKPLQDFLDHAPLAVLFITVALGYLIGKFKAGRFVLGGIAGTLIMGVLIGQLGVKVDTSVKSIFFALFIYAVGYQGGPQFFQALNLRTLNQLASAFIMTVVGLLCVLLAAWLTGLDRGTAAGLAAGALTQSAIIGTAGEAIQQLNVSPQLKQEMQTNIAVGYAMTYIFGSLGPILMVTWFFPTIMRWDIRKEAVALAKKMSGGKAELEPGEFGAIEPVVTRLYRVSDNHQAVGKAPIEIDKALDRAAVEAIIRGGRRLEGADAEAPIQPEDVVAITGRREAVERASDYFGRETEPPQGLELVEENREVILTHRGFIGKPMSAIHDELGVETRHGVFLTAAKRLGHDLPMLPNTVLHRGDELMLTGKPKDLNRVQARLGYKITAARVTDFICFGLGMTLGVLIGMITVKLGGVPVTLGTGGGCLLSGLLFGWLRSVHPQFAALPSGASNFLRDFGLAVFVGVVGLEAGPQAITTIKQYGITLLLLGVGVTLVPQVIVFFFSYYVLRIRNPIEALGCLVGGRSANPGFAALLDKAGNATPVVSFTVCYAVANVFLTLWGPLIVGLVTKNPASPAS
ncbi:MAG: aspartate-alanine antiporter [Planctomycetota bacterium]